MAITVEYVYTMNVRIYYTSDYSGEPLIETRCGSLADIQERCTDILVKHNFTCADVANAETGECVMTVTRT